MTTASPEPVRFEPATTADQPEALELLFADLPAADRQRHRDAALERAGGNSLAGLWTANRGARLLAVSLAEAQPGRTAIFSPCRLVADELRDTSLQLAQAVLDSLRREGV